MKTTIKLMLSLMLLIPFYSNANNLEQVKKTSTPKVSHDYLEIFGLNSKKRNYILTTPQANELTKAEQIFKNWIYTIQQESYLTIFDSTKFYFQHVTFEQFGEKKSAMLVFVPEDEIQPEFNHTFGAGLEIPFQRCLDSYADWYNNGEIFSVLINLEINSVENFKNWRIEKADDKQKAIDDYYAELDIVYALDVSEIKMEIHHYVDGYLHDVISYENFNLVKLPKQRKSSLVFYVDGRIKGIMCFNLEDIRYNCPMSYLTKIYLQERLGYGKVLYTKLTCETIFEWQLIDAEKFEYYSTLQIDELSKYSNQEVTLDNNLEQK